MNSLKFFAEKQHLTGAEQAFVVANSVEYLTVEIEFSSEWENCANTVVFKTSAGEAFSVRLEENGICTVPWEVIEQPYFSMSIYGIYEETRITTNEVIVKVEPSGYAEGKTPQPPTPSVYEEISNQLNSLGTAAQKNVGNLSGEIPIINSSGKLDSVVLPRIPEKITDLSGILPINQGGTGATNITDAQNNLGFMQRYTSFSHLTLTEGYTLKDVFLAMADNTFIEFAMSSSMGITICPLTSGILKIVRFNRNFGYAEFYGNPVAENSAWVGSLHADRGFSWNKIYTSNKTIPIENGGTGATSVTAALNNLGAAKSSDIGDVSTLSTSSKIVVGAINELANTIGTLNDSLEATLNGN